MKTEKSLSRYILVVLSISVVLTALIIVALNAYVNNQRLAQDDSGIITGTAKSLSSYDEGYKDGFKVAREKYAQGPDKTLLIQGEILETGSDQLVVKGQGLYTEESIDDVPDTRIAKITSTTKIVKQTSYTDEEYQVVLQEWNAQGGSEVGGPPLPFTEQEVAIEDVETGARVTVKADEDIRYLEEFVALEVLIEE